MVGPIGFLMSFFKSPGSKEKHWGPENAKIFLILYGITGYFFATKMARLIILMGPIASALSGVALAAIFNWCLRQAALLIWPEKPLESSPAIAAATSDTAGTSKDSDSKGGKVSKGSPKKSEAVKAKSGGVFAKISAGVGSFGRFLNRMYRSKVVQYIRILIAVVICIVVPFYAKAFYDYRCGWG